MELYRKVRLARRGGMSERAAAVHFGVCRASVKKIMGFSVPPGYRRTAEIKRPKLDGFTGFIDQWMQEDLSRNRKQRHTAKRIFERLRDWNAPTEVVHQLGYDYPVLGGLCDGWKTRKAGRYCAEASAG